MRIVLVLAVVCLLSACASGESSGERAFIEGGAGARAAQADLDAQVILRGMEQARSTDERVARVLTPGNTGAAPAPVTR
jgi:hypothetical protein